MLTDAGSLRREGGREGGPPGCRGGSHAVGPARDTPMVFFSCDWGSSSFRLRAVDRSTGLVLGERRSTAGSSTLLPPGATAAVRAAEFARRLQEEVLALDPGRTWSTSPVVASGMVTSAHGWLELPYARTPLPLDGTGLVSRRQRLPDGREVVLVSGLTDGQDVMRGEECELLGLARWSDWPAVAPAGRATVILPGTHCKHVQVDAGKVCGFRTYLTGELYDLLRRHSVLRHSLPPLDAPGGPLDLPALTEGVQCVRRVGLLAALFQVRTGTLLRGLSPAAAEGFLNGVLVGAEFAGCCADPARPLVLSAGERASALYAAGLRALGLGECLHLVPPAVAAALTVSGHAAVLAALAGQEEST